MENVFLTLFNMSITASWIVLAILLIRLIFRRMPKFIGCMLWGLVGLRLIFPFSIESIFSLLPSTETIPDAVITENSFDIHSGVGVIDNRVNDYLADHYYEGVTVPNDNGMHWMRIFSVIWLVGMVLLLGYTVFSFLRLKSKVRVSIRLRENIYLCDSIDTPFILGIFSPKIYLPSYLDDTQMEYILAHETAHLKRRDHLIKPLGFVLLTVYWFNPVLWIAYVLLCRDIELACDEKVIGQMEAEQKKEYSSTLLACSVKRHMIAACPLAFGEIGVKKRIRSVLNYKKPAFWVLVLAVILSIALAVGFLTDPIGGRLTSIEPWTKTLLNDLTGIELTVGTDTRICDEKEVEILTQALKKLRISDQPVSQSLAEDRDATVQIKLLPGENVLCFSNDISEVWINSPVKPTYTYRVENPELLTNSTPFPFLTNLGISGKSWRLQTIQQTTDGAIIGRGPESQDRDPNVTTYNLTAHVSNNLFTIYNSATDQRYNFSYKLDSVVKENCFYRLTSEQTGKEILASIGNTYYDTGKVWFTLILPFEDYHLTFISYNYQASLGKTDAFEKVTGKYCISELLYGKDSAGLRNNWYQIISSGLLSYGSSGLQENNNIGYLVQTKLTEQNFDALFTDETLWLKELTPSRLRSKNKNVWYYTDPYDAANYYLMQQKNGELYLVRWSGKSSSVSFVGSLTENDLIQCALASDPDEVYALTWGTNDKFRTNMSNWGNPVVKGSDILQFSVSGSCEELTVKEEYFTHPTTGEDGYQTETYTLKPDQNGSFSLPLSKRNPGDEYAYYTIPYQGSYYQVYVSFPADYEVTDLLETESYTTYEKYIFEGSADPIQPSITLSTSDDSFVFQYSALSSYLARGRYTLDGYHLTCITDDGLYTYRFTVEYAENSLPGHERFDRLIFDGENSSPLPEYQYSSDSKETTAPVPDEAVFLFRSASNRTQVPTLLAEIDWDIDNDGIKERCTVNFKLTTLSAPYSVTFVVEQETKDGGISEIEYQAEFRLSSANVVLKEDKDGGCVLETWSSNPVEPKMLEAYQIVFRDGEITLVSPTPLQEETAS